MIRSLRDSSTISSIVVKMEQDIASIFEKRSFSSYSTACVNLCKFHVWAGQSIVNKDTHISMCGRRFGLWKEDPKTRPVSGRMCLASGRLRGLSGCP